MNIWVTGAGGFIGKNLLAQLQKLSGHHVWAYQRDGAGDEQAQRVEQVDFVFHLAGVNRPVVEDEFRSGNAEFTEQLCTLLASSGRSIPVVFASSSQVELDNPYGASKRGAEDALRAYAERTGSAVTIFRLPNVFGKWSRPNYNSVVATFCHNIARDLPITISDPQRELRLVYIDDVIQHFLDEIQHIGEAGQIRFGEVSPIHEVSLGRLAELIQSFRRMRTDLHIPNFSDALVGKLYATYLAYLPTDDFAYALDQRVDPRGSLAEFIKSPTFGQIFVSRTKPGITRGNHFHHTKVEKFLVLEGEALIRFQHIVTGEILEYPVRGEDYRVVDIPPGYSHSIENVGDSELVTLFWASEIFDLSRPDTYAQVIGVAGNKGV